MAITVGQIKKILGKLDGVTFTSREELENAVYPLFGPLQSAMPGKSYRDLADILIAKKWATWDRSVAKYTLKFPPEPEAEAEAQRLDIAEVINITQYLTCREIALMVHLHSPGLPCKDNLGFDSLITKGLVEHVDIAEGVDDKAEILKNIAGGKTDLITAIINNHFKEARRVLEEIQDAYEYVHPSEYVYRLTVKGKHLMEDQPDAKLVSPPQ